MWVVSHTELCATVVASLGSLSLANIGLAIVVWVVGALGYRISQVAVAIDGFNSKMWRLQLGDRLNVCLIAYDSTMEGVYDVKE